MKRLVTCSHSRVQIPRVDHKFMHAAELQQGNLAKSAQLRLDLQCWLTASWSSRQLVHSGAVAAREMCVRMCQSFAAALLFNNSHYEARSFLLQHVSRILVLNQGASAQKLAFLYAATPSGVEANCTHLL